jgi:hypothetical protein
LEQALQQQEGSWAARYSQAQEAAARAAALQSEAEADAVLLRAQLDASQREAAAWRCWAPSYAGGAARSLSGSSAAVTSRAGSSGE